MCYWRFYFKNIFSFFTILNNKKLRRYYAEKVCEVKKTRFNTGLEQGTNTLATFRSTTELLPLIKKHYKTTIFYKQEFQKSSEFIIIKFLDLKKTLYNNIFLQGGSSSVVERNVANV